jgi:hypothetical protein
MIQPTLITAVLDWERRLEIAEERGNEGRNGFWWNYLAPLQKNKNKTKSAAVRAEKTGKERKPSTPVYSQECCPEN